MGYLQCLLVCGKCAGRYDCDWGGWVHRRLCATIPDVAFDTCTVIVVGARGTSNCGHHLYVPNLASKHEKSLHRLPYDTSLLLFVLPFACTSVV